MGMKVSVPLYKQSHSSGVSEGMILPPLLNSTASSSASSTAGFMNRPSQRRCSV